MKHAEKGIARVLVIRLGAYAEVDFADLLQFHADTGSAVTRVCDAQGPLDIWVLDAVPGTRRGLSLDLSSDASLPAVYRTSGYVNRLADAQDLRRLAVDAFSGRCAIRPRGRQIKPGVWIDEGARVHRSARIVAPAYIGQGARVRASALVTRFSNVERRCVVDCGTAIENSSVLPFTRVGRGLDVVHSVIEGERLMNLSRNVAFTIEDPKLFGRTASRRHWFGLGGQRIEAVAPGTGTVEIEPIPREAPRQQPALGVLSKGEV
ncbi:MAG: hypothetical protein ACRD20_10315 [Terriglobales bacterium]